VAHIAIDAMSKIGALRTAIGVMMSSAFIYWSMNASMDAPWVSAIAGALIAGVIIGSWWSLPLVPLAMLIGFELWYAFEAPPGSSRGSGRNPTEELVLLMIVLYGYIGIAAVAGSTLSKLVSRGVRRFSQR
jgi:hypothetical protein